MHVLVVGPLPPPNGGMALQTDLLATKLRAEGHSVEVMAVNAPYRPRWTGHIPVLRALARLFPYKVRLRRACARAELVHILANSGWSWNLFSVPAIASAHRQNLPVVLNYRGGLAPEFFARSFAVVRRGLQRCDDIIVPTPFLQRVFAEHGERSAIVPNIVDLGLFCPAPAAPDRPHIVVTRNLEAIYDNATALRAFAAIRRHYADAILTVTGEGPERATLTSLAEELEIADAVHFPGRLSQTGIAQLLRSASLVLNPSTADNSPNSLIEAMASGVPIVSTDVGGVPQLCEDGRHAILIPPRSPQAMAEAVLRVQGDAELRERLIRSGTERATDFSWPRVWPALQQSYQRAREHRARRASPGRN